MSAMKKRDAEAARLLKMISFRVDRALQQRLIDASIQDERKLADTVRRLVLKALDVEERQGR